MSSVGDKIKKQEYIEKANQAEKKYGLPNNILVGLLHAESRFNPNAVSPAGAVGIAQFMPGTAKDFNINPRDPSQSIDAAGRYLSQNYKKLGNWDDTLRSYNMGLGNVYKWKQGRMKLPKETAEYVGKVHAGMGVVSYKEVPVKTSENYSTEEDSSGYREELYSAYSQPNMAASGISAEKEDTAEEVEAKRKIEEVEKEQDILSAYFEEGAQQQTQQPLQEYQMPQQQTPDIYEQYAQVSQFVDSPVAQQGGKIPISSQGVYDYPMQEVIVPTNNGRITMNQVNYPILGTDEFGNQQMMYPGKEYQFPGKNIHEIPQLKNYLNKSR